jgi:MFS family permease
LFVVVAIILFLSAIPLLKNLKTRPRYRDTYQSAWKLTMRKDWRKKSLSLMLYGVDSGINSIYWPLFLFTLAFSYSDLGIVSSVSLVFSLAIILYSSHLTDKINKIKVFRSGCFIASAGNLAKALVWTPLSAIFAQIFFQVGDTMDTTPLTAYIYDKTQKEKLSVGRYIIYREIVQNMGTALIYVVGGLVFLFLPQKHIYLFFIVSAMSIFSAGILAKSFNENFVTHLESIKKKANEHININIEQEIK